MTDAIKVTVTDPDSGEVLGERVIENDYMLICAGSRYLHSTDAHANGTHVLTIKGAEWAGAIPLNGSCGAPGENPYGGDA